MKTPELKSHPEIAGLIKSNEIEFVDLKFVDLPGIWQHFTIPVGKLDDDLFKEGIGFDGSSIRGFQKINESDMLLMPDASTAFIDPAHEIATLSLICDIKDPITGSSYSRDPRNVAKKAEAYLKKSKVADTSYWGPELEFFIFNSIRFDTNSHESYYHIDAQEGIWNSGKADNMQDGPSLGYRIRHKE